MTCLNKYNVIHIFDENIYVKGKIHPMVMVHSVVIPIRPEALKASTPNVKRHCQTMVKPPSPLLSQHLYFSNCCEYLLTLVLTLCVVSTLYMKTENHTLCKTAMCQLIVESCIVTDLLLLHSCFMLHTSLPDFEPTWIIFCGLAFPFFTLTL